jgi:hypothetical protein
MSMDEGAPERGVDRRAFLRAAASAPVALLGGLGQSCGPGGVDAPAGPTLTAAGSAAEASPDPAVPVPKVNGGMNLHPLRCLSCAPTDPDLVPELVALQIEAAYELGFDGLRLTAPFGDRANFLAAIPYVRAARALGIDAVVVLADFSGLSLARALFDDDRRSDVLRLYARVFGAPPEPAAPGLGGLGPRGVGRIAFQVLNEPAGFVGVPPDVYVRELLAPAFVDLKNIDPAILVVSAAEIGTRDGVPRIRAMLEAGLERVTDRIGYHVYDRDVLPLLPDHVRGIVWVTESGASGTAAHLPWVRDVFPEIRARVADVTRIFYYDLYDPERGVFRLIDVVADGPGYRAVVESGALYAHLQEAVARVAAGRPLLRFRTLVPDIRAHFPTAADVEAYEAVERA